MTKPILETTNHLLHLFRHYCGETEVPRSFYDWALLSAIAAVVQDRVWVEKFAGDKLSPNLFTFLIGPSGLGKGTAIKRVLPFIEDVEGVRTHMGPITGAALNALLAGTKTKAGTNKLYLIQEELAYCLGHGDMAFDFIKTLTGIYSPTKKIQKATVTGGHITARNVCINWMAGTTVEWLVKTIPKEAVKGGFVGRLFPVIEDYDYGRRVPEPKYPKDVDEVREHIMMRFQQLALVKGEFKLTKKARKILHHWYMTRPAPENDNLASVWQRQHDMIYKIAILFSLCEDYSRLIKSHHVAQAIEEIARAEESSKVIIRAAESNDESDIVEVVRKIIAKARLIPESVLMRECTKRGVTKRGMLAAIDALMTANDVHIKVRKNLTGKQRWYMWKKTATAHLHAVK